MGPNDLYIVMERGQRYLNPILAKKHIGAEALRRRNAEAQAQSQKKLSAASSAVARLPARVKFRYHFTVHFI